MKQDSLGREATLVFAGLLALGALAQVPSIHGHDGILNAAYARSVWFDGDMDFTNEYRHYDWVTEGRFELAEKPRHPETGLPLNFYGVGAPLLWAPFYVLAEPFRPDAQFPGDDPVSARAIAVGTLFWTALGLALLWRLAREWVGRFAAGAALALVVCCSPLHFYALLHPSMSHGPAFFAVAWMVWGAFAPGERTRLGWFGLGASCGLVVVTRYQDAVLLAIPLAAEIGRVASAGPRGFDWRRAALGYSWAALGLALALAPQMWAWWILHGNPISGPVAYGETGLFDPTRPVHAWAIFFSPRHGLLYWHPALAAGGVGLALALRGSAESKPERAAAVALLTGVAIHAYIIACWGVWWGGASFGHRMFISILPALFLGAAGLFERFRGGAARGALVALLAFAALWNAGLTIQYGAGMISREGPVTHAEMLANNTRAVPKFVWTRTIGRLMNTGSIGDSVGE